MWAIVSALVISLLGAGCGDGASHRSQHSTLPPGQINTSVVPAKITVPYVNAVLVKLNAIYSDGLRSAVAAHGITSTTKSDFQAIFSSPLYGRELPAIQAAVNNFPGTLTPSGTRAMTVLRLYTATSKCVFAAVSSDYSRLVQPAPVALKSEYYELVPNTDKASLNSTRWVFGDNQASYTSITGRDTCSGKTVSP